MNAARVSTQYQVELEAALRAGTRPPEPPKGASQEIQDLYQEAMANMHRLEVRSCFSLGSNVRSVNWGDDCLV